MAEHYTRDEIANLRGLISLGTIENPRALVDCLLDEIEALQCEVIASKRRNYWCDRCDTGDFSSRCECVKADPEKRETYKPKPEPEPVPSWDDSDDLPF
jgi:hypothetical protein